MALGHHTELPSGSGHSSLLLNQNAAEHNSLSKSVGEGPAALDDRLGLQWVSGKMLRVGAVAKEEKALFGVLVHHRLTFFGFFGSDAILMYFLPLKDQPSKRRVPPCGTFGRREVEEG